MRTTPSASPPLSKVYMRASRTPRSRPPTRSSDSRRPPPPSRGPGAETQLDRFRDQSVSLETSAGLGDDAPNRWEGSMAKGILVAAMDFSAAPEDEFHDWYDLEHVPERLRVPGFVNADRWIGTTDPKVSVATYDLDNVDVLKSPPYLTVGGENGSPWTKRTARFRKSLLRYEGEQLFPGDKTAPEGAAALLLIGMNVAPEHEHEFNEWYNTEHIPALGSVPGTLCARRYRGSGATQRYAALYHLASSDVVSSAAWKTAANTPWTEKLRPHFRDHLRFACARYSRA